VDIESLDRVRSVIAELGITQKLFALKIGLDESKLTKSLNGTRRFSSLELALIAETGGRTVEWILSGVEPRSMSFAYRTATADVAVNHQAGERILIDIAERFEGLEAIGYAPKNVDLPAKPKGWSYVDGSNALASEALSRLNRKIMDLSTLDLIDAVEDAFGVNVVIADLPDGCDGLSYQDGAFRAVVLAATENAARQRISLGHELGHIIWGDAKDVIEESISTGSDDLSEKRANTFSAAFTMPSDEINIFLKGRSAFENFDELTWRFGVSPSAMSWRLFNLKLLSDSQRMRLSGRSTRVCAEAVEAGEEHLSRNADAMDGRAPWRLAMASIHAYRSGEISIAPVADLLGMTDAKALSLLADPDTEMWIENPER
jgi:Zn-dependent peptidase ImmA (M78 family)/transcriptional regulator with XRE-family HTH domain